MSMSSDEGEWPEVTGEEQRKPPRHKTKRKKRKSLVLTEEQLVGGIALLWESHDYHMTIT